MKSICSVGTNAAKCVAKLYTMNAVLILIALHSMSHFQILAKFGLSVKMMEKLIVAQLVTSPHY